jgi:glycosyltransferase involved in cell wall biosynthesis
MHRLDRTALSNTRDWRAIGMNDTPDVSVVISTHNRAPSLVLTLESLARQETPPGLHYEVIVVDNNSTDSTRAVVEGVRSRGFTRLHYRFEPQQGVSYGRNTGISIARAPIVAFTDDDNDVSPAWVATIKATLDAHPEVDVLGGPILPRWPFPPPLWLDRRHWSPLAIMDYGDRPFPSNAAWPLCFLTANLAVRRKTFERVGVFSPSFPRGQDHEFLLRFWRAGGQAWYGPALVAHARIQPVRLTRRYHREWYRRHGVAAASMRLLESIGPLGSLLDTPIGGAATFGALPFVYAEFFRETKAWVGSLPRGNASLRLHHSDRMRYLASYLRERASGRGRWGHLRHVFGLLGTRCRTVLERAPLSTRRLAIVLILMAVMVGGSISDIVFDREDWPLSQYPMFSTVDLRPTLQVIRVVGVTRETVPREIQLMDDDSIGPLDQCRLSTALARTFNNPSRRPLGPAMLRGVLDLYEARRGSGENDGPPLEAVRAYDMTWTLDADARNVDRPDVRRLIAEVRP